jgi:hypothetical protein
MSDAMEGPLEAMAVFEEAMRELCTGPGISCAELDGVKAGVLRLGGFPMSSFVTWPLREPMQFGTPLPPLTFLPFDVEPELRFPEAMGQLLDAFLNPPSQDGPPYVRTFAHPMPEEVQVDDEDWTETVLPAWPSFTVEQRPTFTGVLAYLADGGEQR